MQYIGNLRPILRRRQTPLLHRAHEPVEMILQPKEPAAKDMDDVIDGVRAGEPPVEHRQRGLSDRDEILRHIGGPIGVRVHESLSDSLSRSDRADIIVSTRPLWR